MPNLQVQDQGRASPDRRLGEVLLDNKGRIRAVNQTAERMIGRPVDQIEGRPFHEAVENQGLCALMQYALISLTP